MKSHLLRSLLFAALIAMAWFFQLLPSSAVTYPTQWKLVPAQDANAKWWGALQVQTVPGVVYHLQRSTTLMAGGWTTVRSLYGMGQEWICPVLPGSAPPVGTLPQEVLNLPAQPAAAIRQSSLSIGRNAAGDVVLSFLSQDDGTMKQKVLTGTPLDPAWDDFDSFYLNAHGSQFFGISPQLREPTEGPAVPPPLGPLDEAMLATFTTALPEMTANILNSIEAAKNYSPAHSNPEDRAFYRISADWGIDTNGGGRFDWQQLILDGTDPFSPAASTGDLASAGTGSSSDGYPVPTDAQPATPIARIQQQSITISRRAATGSTELVDISTDLELTPEQEEAVRQATTLGALKDVLDGMSIPEDRWSDPSFVNFANTRIKGSSPESTETWDEFHYTRVRFRLKLDGAAPVGGYQIPMRIGIMRQGITVKHPRVVSFPAANPSDPLYRDLMLVCPEGQISGPAVDFPAETSFTENQRITYVPASVSTREDDIIIDGNVLGATPGPVPENGTCVVENDAFAVDLANQDGDYLVDYHGAPLKVFWRSRQLNGNGTLSGWAKLTRVGFESIPHEGTHTYIQARQKGVHQLQALLVLPNGSEIEFPFLRMRNAKSIKDGGNNENPILKAGRPDYFGVAQNHRSKGVRDMAVSWLGSGQYAQGVDQITIPGAHPLSQPNLKGADKCNLFVFHVANTSGATVPTWNFHQISARPPDCKG